LAAFAATLQMRVFVWGTIIAMVLLVGLGWHATRRRRRGQ